MKKLILLMLLPVGIFVNAQSITTKLQDQKQGEGLVTINQDENISLMLLERLDEVKNQHKISGFRILIFSDYSQNSLEKASSVRSSFREKYNYSIEYVYNAPDSKLYVGNFRTKSEAQKALNNIKKDFPKAFIKPDKIDLPDLD